MVGDIDFLFSSQDYPRAIQVLKEWGYNYLDEPEKLSPEHRHYPRLIKKDCMAAIEIHSEFLRKSEAHLFNYDTVKSSIQVLDNVAMLSDGNMLNLSILANQINDYRFNYRRIALRNAYDVFLLSKKCNAKNAVNTISKLSHPLHCFLAACGEVFNTPDSLEYTKTKKTKAYLILFKEQFTNPIKANRRHTRIKAYLYLKHVLSILYMCVFYKKYRAWLFLLITDPAFWKRKLGLFK